MLHVYNCQVFIIHQCIVSQPHFRTLESRRTKYWQLSYSIFIGERTPNIRVNSWWRPQMEIFSALLALCAGNSPVTGEFHIQRPVTHSFDVFFDRHLNKPLSKQWWDWWFETPWHPLWRHCDVIAFIKPFWATLYQHSTPLLVQNASTHWGRGKMPTNFLTTISNEFSWMKIQNFDSNFT